MINTRYLFGNYTHFYQFWKNHKGTPLEFNQKVIQNLISLGKIYIYLCNFIKREVAVLNRIFYVLKKMKINGPVLRVARGGILQELSVNQIGIRFKDQIFWVVSKIISNINFTYTVKALRGLWFSDHSVEVYQCPYLESRITSSSKLLYLKQNK